jgi:hypothetical protein
MVDPIMDIIAGVSDFKECLERAIGNRTHNQAKSAALQSLFWEALHT